MENIIIRVVGEVIAMSNLEQYRILATYNLAKINRMLGLELRDMGRYISYSRKYIGN